MRKAYSDEEVRRVLDNARGTLSPSRERFSRTMDLIVANRVVSPPVSWAGRLNGVGYRFFPVAGMAMLLIGLVSYAILSGSWNGNVGDTQFSGKEDLPVVAVGMLDEGISNESGSDLHRIGMPDSADTVLLAIAEQLADDDVWFSEAVSAEADAIAAEAESIEYLSGAYDENVF